MGNERGSVTPLIIGFAAVLVLLVAVVVDASAAFLRRQQLDSVADAAALAATDGVQGDAAYTHGLGERARIDPVAARRYAADYLAGVRDRYPGLSFEVRTTAETVVVRISVPMRLPLHVGDLGDTTIVTGTAASVVTVTD